MQLSSRSVTKSINIGHPFITSVLSQISYGHRAMSSSEDRLHFVLFPFMAQGHTIPMLDIARLLAQHGAVIILISTPANALRFKPVINRAVESGLKIQVHELTFPSEEAGLPEGFENIDMLPSSDLLGIFFTATSKLEKQVEELLEELNNPRPSCMISDICFPYTTELARKFGIPRIVFHGMCCFTHLCSHKIQTSKVIDCVSSEFEYFQVPDMPEGVQFTKNQVDSFADNPSSSDWASFWEKIEEAQNASYGILFNTFEELEPDFAPSFQKAKEKKIWCIGPVSLCNKDNLDKSRRGKKASIDETQCLKWLDSWEPKSVIYACMGSICNLSPSQVTELGLGLEAWGKPFIWIVRDGYKSKELETLMQQDGFEERTKGRGLVIRGWAPQVLILSHPAIGGFLTHCGWNSSLEGIIARVPMVTWPLFGDQYFNERLIVHVLKIGVPVGAEVAVMFGKEEKSPALLVKREDVKKAVEKLMKEGDEEAEGRRRRAKKLAEMAKKTTEEGGGGSSYRNIRLFLEDIEGHENGDGN